MKLETRFYVAAIALLLVGLVLGFLPLDGGCGSPFVAGGALSDSPTAASGACQLARPLLRAPAVACLLLGVLSWIVGVGRWGFDDSKNAA